MAFGGLLKMNDASLCSMSAAARLPHALQSKITDFFVTSMSVSGSPQLLHRHHSRTNAKTIAWIIDAGKSPRIAAAPCASSNADIAPTASPQNLVRYCGGRLSARDTSTQLSSSVWPDLPRCSRRTIAGGMR